MTENKGDLISREALKKAIEKAFETANLSEYEACICVSEIYDKEIDNAPTVDTDEIYKKGYHAGFFATHGEPERPQGEQIAWEQGYEFGKNEKRLQDNITEEDIQNAIKAGYENGYSMAQAKYQRPQGEWVVDNWGMYHCNYCMKEKQQLFHNFCSNCGADMRGEQNE